MITTILSQRSFNNSWASPITEKGNNPVPTGVVVDICVTYSLASLGLTTYGNGIEVYLQVSTDVGGKLTAAISARNLPNGGHVLLGSLSECTVGVPVAFDCIPGVHCSALFGFIPKVTQPTTYDDTRISDDLIIVHDNTLGARETNRKVEIVNLIKRGDSDWSEVVVVPLVSDARLELGHGIVGSMQPSGVLEVENDPDVYDPETADQYSMEFCSQKLIKTLGGARADKSGTTVKMYIQYNGEPVPVVGYPAADDAQLAVLQTHEIVTACDVVDPIDDYIGPNSPHDGVQVLDALYVSDLTPDVGSSILPGTQRNVTYLFHRTYGWGVSEKLRPPDKDAINPETGEPYGEDFDWMKGCESLATTDTKFDVALSDETETPSESPEE